MTVHKVGGGSGKPRACLTPAEADALRADLTHWQEVCYAHEAELQCFRAENARLRRWMKCIADHNSHGLTLQTEMAKLALAGEVKP